MFAGLLNKGFRGSLPLIVIVFLATAILNYFSLITLEQDYYPNLFYNYFANQVTNQLALTALNYLFIAIGVFLVNLIAVNQEIVDKQNYFPVFLYLLFCVVAVNPQQISSQVFANVFILYAIYKLFDTYRQEHVLRQIFDAAFWLSVSAFITISTIISFPLFFIILLILRPFYWREWVVALLGFFCPVFIYECMAYLSDFNQWYLSDAVGQYLDYLRIPSFSEYYLPFTVMLFLLLVTSVLYNLVNGFGNTVKKQKAKSIMLWFIFFAIFGFFSGGSNSTNIILTYSFPLAFFIGDFMYSVKQVKFTNTILTLLLLCACLVFAGQMAVI